jgi:hydrogenase maturation protein HypF
VDDSVVREIAGRRVTLRLGRGLGPLPIPAPRGQSIIAVGGHQKTAIAVSNAQQVALGVHVGDLQTVAAQVRHQGQIAALQQLYGIERASVVHDDHPDYASTRWAERQHRPRSVQHHHAHVIAAMAEHGMLDREVLGVAFDGTGYGEDGTIWGGEFLLATRGGFRRVGHLRTFPLPGGERAVLEPWRVAAALLIESGVEDWLELVSGMGIPAPTARRVAGLTRNRRFSPRTSSVGRLFDAVAAIVLSRHSAHYDGQPAIELESVAAVDMNAVDEIECYDLTLEPGDPLQIDWRTMIGQLVRDHRDGVSAPAMAGRFHGAVAQVIAALTRCYPTHPVALCGGVFQNRSLLERVLVLLRGRSEPVIWPQQVPPGDGGLSLGQLFHTTARE